MSVKKACMNLVLTVIFLAGQFVYSPQKVSFASELTVSAPVFKAISVSKSGLNFIWDRDFSDDSDRIEALKMFFTALAVPQKDWWVNLGVLETEDTVLGPGLFETDLGMALIESDLMLKQDAMRLLSPDSKTGRRFWNTAEDVAAGLGMDVSDLNIRPRFWMEAGDIVVKTNSASAYIESAPIKVNVEIEGTLPKRAKKILETALMDSVIPELEFDVNNSKKFSVLRQAHSAFVLALWYKSRRSGNVPFSNFADSYRVGALKGNYKWRQRNSLYNFVRMYYGARKGVDSSVVGGGYEGPKELKEEVLREDISVEAREKGDKAGAFVKSEYEIEFGTSGHRIDRNEFTEEEVENMIRADAIAVARYYQAHKEEFLENGKEGIIIGRDSRENNKKYRDIIVKELLHAGIKVVVLDRPVTTPFIAFSIYKLNKALAINLTASHNPANYTGFKVTPADGGAAGKDVTDEIQKYANIAMSVIEKAKNAEADSVTAQLKQEVGIKYDDALEINNEQILADIMIDPVSYEVPSEGKDTAVLVPLIEAFAKYEEQQLRRLFGENYDKLVENVKTKAQSGKLAFMLTALYGAGGDVQKYVIKKIFGEEVVKKVFAEEPMADFNGLASPNPVAPIIWEAFYKSEGVNIRKLTEEEKEELKDLFSDAEEVVFNNEKSLPKKLDNWSAKKMQNQVNTEAGNFFLHIFNNAFQTMYLAYSLMVSQQTESLTGSQQTKSMKDVFNKTVDDIKLILEVWDKALEQNRAIPIGPTSGASGLSYSTFVAWAKGDYSLPKGTYVAAIDGDGDRFGVVDKTGDFITPNEMGAILYYFMATNRASGLPVPMLVKTVATSDFPVEVAKLFDGKAFEVAVGFKNFRSYWNGNYGLGLESSAHAGFLDSKTWDDGILMDVMDILVAGNISEPSLSDYKRKIEREIEKVFHFVELAVDVKENPQIKADIEDMHEVFDKCSKENVVGKDYFYAHLNLPEFKVIDEIAKEFGKDIEKIITVDGVKVVFDDGSYFVVRPGTEPVVRLYSETWAKDKKSAIASNDKMVKIVKEKLLSPKQKAGILKNEEGNSYLLVMGALAALSLFVLLSVCVFNQPYENIIGSGKIVFAALAGLSGAVALAGVLYRIGRRYGLFNMGVINDADIVQEDEGDLSFAKNLLDMVLNNKLLLGDLIEDKKDAFGFSRLNLKEDGNAESNPTSTFMVKDPNNPDWYYPLLFSVNKPVLVEIPPDLARHITSISKRLAVEGKSVSTVEGEEDNADMMNPMDKKIIIKSALQDVVDLMRSEQARVLLNKSVIDMFMEYKPKTQGGALVILNAFLRGANISDDKRIADALRFCAATALLNEDVSIPGLKDAINEAYQVGKACVTKESSNKINSPEQKQEKGGVDFGKLLIRPYEI